MIYKIDSRNLTFNGKGVVLFFEQLSEACGKLGITFFVMGAFSRDLVLENIYKQEAGLATRDIDVAIRINSWKKYDDLILLLKNKYDFKDGGKVHEFISADGVYTDIVPYGEIEENRMVVFPDVDYKEVNMMGFKEVFGSCLEVELDGQVNIKVTSLEGMCILKFFAWNDRRPESISSKHVRDIVSIIESYFDAKVLEFGKEYSDLFDDEKFDTILAGARALGRDVKKIAITSTDLLNGLDEIFSYILKDVDNSLFINQMASVTRKKYEDCLTLFNSFYQGYSEDW